MLSETLRCGKCGWRTTCGEDELARRLRKLGLLRRATHPPEEMVSELLTTNSSRLTCDACGAVGLLIAPNDENEGWDDWRQTVLCQICRQPIPPERLEVFPTSKRCVACQDATDRGQTFEEPEFCPKCGALVELRVSRGGGVTRYKRFCTGEPPCQL